MTDFNKILDKAKELETKMKESQENIKNITATGVSGGDSVKIILNGEGEIVNLDISSDILKEDLEKFIQKYIGYFAGKSSDIYAARILNEIKE